MLDALSRLMNDPAVERCLVTTDEGTPDDVFAFNGFFVEMSPSFRDRVIAGYSVSKEWADIRNALKEGGPASAGVQFQVQFGCECPRFQRSSTGDGEFGSIPDRRTGSRQVPREWFATTLNRVEFDKDKSEGELQKQIEDSH